MVVSKQKNLIGRAAIFSLLANHVRVLSFIVPYWDYVGPETARTTINQSQILAKAIFFIKKLFLLFANVHIAMN